MNALAMYYCPKVLYKSNCIFNVMNFVIKFERKEDEKKNNKINR